MNKPCTKCVKKSNSDSVISPCVGCKDYEKYTNYLEAKRKYKPGRKIENLIALMQQDYVIWHGKTTHIEVIKNLQYNTIMRGLRNGWFYRAEKNESEV